MNRRGFLALASGLLVPVPEPVRRYCFAPLGGWPSIEDGLRDITEALNAHTHPTGDGPSSPVVVLDDEWSFEVQTRRVLRAPRFTLRLMGAIEQLEVKGVIKL